MYWGWKYYPQNHAQEKTLSHSVGVEQRPARKTQSQAWSSLQKCHGQVLGKVIIMPPKITSFISDFSSVKHSLGPTVTFGSVVWVVLAWKIREKDMVYLCPPACKKLNLGEKITFVFTTKKSCVFSSPQDNVYIQKCVQTDRPAVFHERKNHNGHHSDHLLKIFLHMDQNVCKTFLLFATFENCPAACFSHFLTSTCLSSQIVAL